MPGSRSARRVSAANVKRKPARAGLGLEHGVGAAAGKEKPITRLQLQLGLLDEKSRSALEYEHPLVMGLLETKHLTPAKLAELQRKVEDSKP